MDNATATTGVIEAVVSWLDHLPAPLATFIAGLLPGLEPRYAVILGVLLGLPVTESIILSVASAIILALLLTSLIGYIDRMLPHLPYIGGFYRSYRERASSRARRYVDRYGMLGLIVFVAIPLPATGMYTGAVAGLLLGVRGRRLLAALLLGGLISVALTSLTLIVGVSV